MTLICSVLCMRISRTDAKKLSIGFVIASTQYHNCAILIWHASNELVSIEGHGSIDWL